MKPIIRLTFITSLLVLPLIASAQRQFEAGSPLISNYDTKQLGGHVQNFGVIQDDQGIMYFANGLGVLQYDGAKWHLITTSKKSSARAFAKDKNGRIYVSAQGDFGYLAPDSHGQLQFVSLLDLLEDPSILIGGGDVHVNSEGVYARTQSVLIRYSPPNSTDHNPTGLSAQESGTTRLWPSETRYGLSFMVDGRLYINERDVGLLEMVDDSLQLIPGGELFSDLSVEVMLPRPKAAGVREEDVKTKQEIIIGTPLNGLYIYDGTGCRPFSTEATSFLQDNFLSSGVTLPDGTLALGTVRGGLVVMSREGEALQYLDRSSGLMDNRILDSYVDMHGALWLGLDSGAARVELPSPITLFGESAGLNSYGYSIARHQGRIYIATGLGVSYLESGKIKQIPNLRTTAWHLLNMENRLLLAASAGLYELDGTKATSIKNSERGSFNTAYLHQSRQDSSRVFVGLRDGLAILRLSAQNGRWVDEGRINGVNGDINSIVEKEPGRLWLGSFDGVLQVDFNEGPDLHNPVVRSFGEEQNLPNGGVKVFLATGRLFFAKKEGLFRYDEDASVFVRDTTFASVSFGGSEEEYTLKEDFRGNLLINFGAETAMAIPRSGGTYDIEKRAFNRISNVPNYFTYPEPDGVVWIASEKHLIRYDPRVNKNYVPDFQTLIRRVVIDEDSTLFGGTYGQPGGDIGTQTPELAYAHNNIIFEFSAISYEATSENRFQIMLEGFNDRWSAWSPDAKREFTNLPEGEYTFHVRARNVYEHMGKPADYSFVILPPWFRAWWAYALYVGLFVVSILGFNRIRTRKLEARSKELENTIRERTQVIREREAEVRAHADELETMDDIIKVINREEAIDNVLQALLEQGVKLFPQAEKATFLLYDPGIERFRFRAVLGYELESLQKITLSREEIIQRTTEDTTRLDSDVSVVKDVSARDGSDKFENLSIPKSILSMTVTLDQELVGVLFLDNLTDPNAFDASDLDKLKRYREHAVSAIAKARQKENIELLSRIGKDITASLSIKNIVDTVYENVNALMDASVFDIGIYNPENNQIDFPGTKEKGETMPPSSDDLDDVNRLSAWCFKQQKEILIHDYKKDYKEYIEVLPDPRVGELPESIIYVPMAHKGEAIGVITAQSFRKNAYTEYHVNILRNLAAYTAIAMDNASAYKRLDATLQNLQSTQEKLVTQEKLASLGALTAGIAHEIKNPLNFVNNFAELSAELVDELHEELLKNKDNKKAAVAADIEDILNDLKQNAQKINEHGKRADSIVRSMLQHSRGKPGEKQEMDLNAMLEEDLNLAYHGMRAQNSEFNAEMLKELDQSLGTVKVVPQDISRVFLNIMTNGFYEAFSRKSRENGDFSPSLLVGTRKMGRRVEVRIRDNGSGIPEAIQDKLFNPFFTTKPAGQGTGLGLSISHDIIVQGHNGDIKFETQAGEFTEFIITLPIA